MTDQPTTTASILDEIAAERARQDAKWGEQNHPDGDPIILGRLADGGPFGTPNVVALSLADHYEIPSATRAKYICDTEAKFGGRTWPSIAVEELAEVVEATTEGRGRTRTELVQLGAVIVAWIESIDRAVEADVAAMPIVETTLAERFIAAATAPLPPFDPTEVREHPGTGQPMTGVEHPADGTWSPELSSEQDGAAA